VCESQVVLRGETCHETVGAGALSLVREPASSGGCHRAQDHRGRSVRSTSHPCIARAARCEAAGRSGGEGVSHVLTPGGIGSRSDRAMEAQGSHRVCLLRVLHRIGNQHL
jgi:hypothetical protein